MPTMLQTEIPPLGGLDIQADRSPGELADSTDSILRLRGRRFQKVYVEVDPVEARLVGSVLGWLEDNSQSECARTIRTDIEQTVHENDFERLPQLGERFYRSMSEPF